MEVIDGSGGIFHLLIIDQKRIERGKLDLNSIKDQ